MNSSDKAAIAYLQNLMTERFWGHLAFKFEGGHIVHVRREENIKPSTIQFNLRQTGEFTIEQSNTNS